MFKSEVIDWDALYRSGKTGWDIGEAHPGLINWLSQHTFDGEVFVPGCGRGHDVHAIAQAGIPVLGVDISPEAIRCALRLNSGAHFQVADILTPAKEWTKRFSGAFEHTCYCAIPPSRRTDYAHSLATVLRSGAIFLACFYMGSPTEIGGDGAPPFPTDRMELDLLFDPFFRLDREWLTYPAKEGRRDLFREYIRI